MVVQMKKLAGLAATALALGTVQASAAEVAMRRVFSCVGPDAKMEIYIPESLWSGLGVQNAKLDKQATGAYSLDLTDAGKGKMLEPVHVQYSNDKKSVVVTQVDPLADIRVAEEALVVLVRVAVDDRRLDLAADPADRSDGGAAADVGGRGAPGRFQSGLGDAGEVRTVQSGMNSEAAHERRAWRAGRRTHITSAIGASAACRAYREPIDASRGHRAGPVAQPR